MLQPVWVSLCWWVCLICVTSLCSRIPDITGCRLVLFLFKIKAVKPSYHSTVKSQQPCHYLWRNVWISVGFWLQVIKQFERELGFWLLYLSYSLYHYKLIACICKLHPTSALHLSSNYLKREQDSKFIANGHTNFLCAMVPNHHFPLCDCSMYCIFPLLHSNVMSNKRSKCSFHHCWSLSLWVYFWSGIVEEEWNRLIPTSCHSREQGPQEGVKPLWWSVVKIILHDGLHTDYVNQVHIRVTHSKFKTFRCTQSLRMHRQYNPLRRSPPPKKNSLQTKNKSRLPEDVKLILYWHVRTNTTKFCFFVLITVKNRLQWLCFSSPLEFR